MRIVSSIFTPPTAGSRRIGSRTITIPAWSGVSFVGNHSVTLTLTAGQWSFYTSAGVKSASSFTVTA